MSRSRWLISKLSLVNESKFLPDLYFPKLVLNLSSFIPAIVHLLLEIQLFVNHNLQLLTCDS